ncbi:hypothetical protein DFJ73DRAFT_823766 [Zopfochytrium polystomum]|nr:hypothetical protein DFJ73DRAFT_823766 [Zopfochytrium polystomum]
MADRAATPTTTGAAGGTLVLHDLVLNDSPSPALVIPVQPSYFVAVPVAAAPDDHLHVPPPSAPTAVSATTTTTATTATSSTPFLARPPLRVFRSHLRAITAALSSHPSSPLARLARGDRVALLCPPASFETVACLLAITARGASAVLLSSSLPTKDLIARLKMVNTNAAGATNLLRAVVFAYHPSSMSTSPAATSTPVEHHSSASSASTTTTTTDRTHRQLAADIVKSLGVSVYETTVRVPHSALRASRSRSSAGRGKEEESPEGTNVSRPEVSVDLLAAGKAAGSEGSPAADPAIVKPDDEAVYLFTSGVSDEPKGVPLTHRSIVSSLHHLKDCMELNPNDVSYLVMPLFHVHGLIGVLLSTLFSGGTVVMPPAFHPSSFKVDLPRFKVTWFSAVPSIHKILLRTKGINQGARLRFIRSGSASLPPNLLLQLEKLFHAPVIEAYAVTETAHLVTSNALPPGIRKAGSAGKGISVEVKIVDRHGRDVPTMRPGEVCVRGENLFAGYERSTLNELAFLPASPDDRNQSRWFLTGDLGHMDESSFLYLHGRVTDQIFVPDREDGTESGKQSRRGQTRSSLSASSHLPNPSASPLLGIPGLHHISPLWVENEIFELDGVEDVVVFGVPPPVRVLPPDAQTLDLDTSYAWANHLSTRSEWAAKSSPQQYVHAAVVIRPSARHHVTAERVREWVRARVTGAGGDTAWVPEVVHVVEALPKTATGKKVRRVLAERIVRGLGVGGGSAVSAGLGRKPEGRGRL